MGFKISWLGFNELSKDRALEKIGLYETGEPDEANEAPFSGAVIPGGWFILFVNDFDFVRSEFLELLSGDCRVVGCRVHEGVMMSSAFAFERGKALWQVTHDAEEGLHHLSVSGTPPLELQAIRDHLTQMQNEEDVNGAAEVDYIFDVPVELAAHVSGYRHDRSRFDWGEPTFIRLEAAQRRRPWSLKRLFGQG